MNSFFSRILEIINSVFKKQEEKVGNIPNIVVEPRIENKFRNGIKTRYQAINEVVIHGTAGGSSCKALIDWMLSGERDADYSQGIALFHYAIDYDGTVYQIINPDTGWVWHSSSGAHDELTIGIELMNTSWSNATPYTEAQYKSLAQLILNVLVPKYPQIKHLISHNYNQLRFSPSYGGKECPGSGFDWTAFKPILESEGANLKSYAVQEIYLN